MLTLVSDRDLAVPSVLNTRTLDADSILSAYKAAVAAGGGAVDSDPITLGLIEDLITAGLYNQTKVAIIAGGGADNYAGTPFKMWSVGPDFTVSDFNSGGQATYTTSGSLPVVGTSSNIVFGFDNIELRDSGAMSFFAVAPEKVSSNGPQVLLLDGTITWFMFPNIQLWSLVQNSGTTIFPVNATGSRTGLADPPYAPDNPHVAAWRWDFTENQLWSSVNGVNTPGSDVSKTGSLVYQSIPNIAEGHAVNLRIDLGAVGDKFRELVIVTGEHTREQDILFAQLRRARLP